MFELNKSYGASSSSGLGTDDIAASILEQDDADGDGLLSLSETSLDEDRFNEIDSDGDGYISAEELSADAKSHMQQNAAMGQLSVLMQSGNSDEIAASILEKDDEDGDGLLSLSETSLDEDRFNEIDSDGDGYISAEELSADMQENMAEGSAATAAAASESVAATTQTASTDETTSASSSGSSSSSSSSDDEEDYDEYDLNKDGVVTVDELLQAFNQGDSGAASKLQSMGDGMLSAMSQRFATEAYQQQQQLV